MGFFAKFRSFLIKFVFWDFPLLVKNDVTGLLVSKLAGSEIF
jgi:hypothetical protein